MTLFRNYLFNYGNIISFPSKKITIFQKNSDFFAWKSIFFTLLKYLFLYKLPFVRFPPFLFLLFFYILYPIFRIVFLLTTLQTKNDPPYPFQQQIIPFYQKHNSEKGVIYNTLIICSHSSISSLFTFRLL